MTLFTCRLGRGIDSPVLQGEVSRSPCRSPAGTPEPKVPAAAAAERKVPLGVRLLSHGIAPR